MDLRIGNHKMSLTDDEVMAVTLLSVLKWNASSLTDVIDHLCHYVRKRDSLDRQEIAKVS